MGGRWEGKVAERGRNMSGEKERDEGYKRKEKWDWDKNREKWNVRESGHHS